MTKTKIKACGNPECCISTGIHEGLTFGSGELDDYGYWEKPCAICARKWDEKRPQLLKKHVKEHLAEHPGKTPQDAINHLKIQHEYLFWKGWPFPKTAS